MSAEIEIRGWSVAEGPCLLICHFISLLFSTTSQSLGYPRFRLQEIHAFQTRPRFPPHSFPPRGEHPVTPYHTTPVGISFSPNGKPNRHPQNVSGCVSRCGIIFIVQELRLNLTNLLQHNFPPPRPPPRAYDQYIPPRQNSSYRDEQNFRASSWRPDERSLPYNTRTPSPPRYEPARPVEDSWNRAGPSSSSWTDRRPSDPWGNGRRRDSAVERFFEPSDAWKQNHHDIRNRQDE